MTPIATIEATETGNQAARCPRMRSMSAGNWPPIARTVSRTAADALKGRPEIVRLTHSAATP
jgi:hypothetical protein